MIDYDTINELRFTALTQDSIYDLKNDAFLEMLVYHSYGESFDHHLPDPAWRDFCLLVAEALEHEHE